MLYYYYCYFCVLPTTRARTALHAAQSTVHGPRSAVRSRNLNPDLTA